MSYARRALEEFHEFYGKDNPYLGLKLRQTLIEEEFEELREELRKGSDTDIKKLYKELADLVYVCYGLDVHLGGYLDKVFSEVHESNMSKLWTCEGCMGDGVGHFGPDGKAQTVCIYCDGNGKVVRRREDGKILKPSTYRPPELAFLDKKEPQDV